MKEKLESVLGIVAIRSIDLLKKVVIGDLESPSGQMIHKMEQMISLTTVVVVNSFEELDPIVTYDLKCKFKKILLLGLFSLSITPTQST